MTEDDTFNVLRKTPRKELEEWIRLYLKAHPSIEYEEWMSIKVGMLKRNGWTMYEYLRRQN